MTRKLFKFNWDCGRMGEVEGVFVASQENIDAAMGQHIYFGEILGKHSEVYGDLEEDDLVVLTDDQDFIDKAIEYGIVPTGYSPLDYLPEEFYDDEDD